MSTHAAAQKRQREESAPQTTESGKSSQAAGVGLPLFMQAKLTIGASDDPLEQEADRVADEVLATSSNPAVSVVPTRIQRFTGRATGETGTAPASVDRVLAGSGRPLEPALQQDMERRFGHDFSRVRVHSDGVAEQSARDVNANAYTVGHDIVFGTGKYAPETTEGKRLLAHELAHVQQQHGATLIPSVVQRQPSSSVPPSNSSAGATSPGYEEAAHAPSYRVRIVAHASPRWRGARSAADADRRNLELSQRRADAVRFEVERLLATRLGAGMSVNIDTMIEEQDDTVGVAAEARGRRDTLLEAKGDRSDDALQRRRVDVIIQSSQRISGSAGASRPLLTRPTASKFWYVSVDMSAGGSVGLAGSLLKLTLENASSGQTMHGTVWAIGGGPKASLGASVSPWSDSTSFYTDEPLDFSNFHGVWVRYESVGFNMFVGYEKAYISFIGLGSGAQSIDVSGGTAGTVGIGGSIVAGKLSLDGSYPPNSFPIKDSDTTVVPYESTERGEDVHKVLFATESASLKDLEVDILDSFLASVVASKR